MKSILIAIFFATTMHAQTTSGWCSPIFINSPINAPLTINCNGVDPGIVAALKKKLAREQVTTRDLRRRYAQVQQEINTFILQYRELEKKLSQYELLPEEKRRAEELLRDGKLDEAGALFDQLIQQHHNNLIQLAQLHYLRAKVYLLESDESNMRAQLERSHALDPENLEYANDYGGALAEVQQFDEARIVFRRALDLAQDNAARSFESQYYESQITSNLGVLELEREHWDDAQKYLSAANNILRALVKQTEEPKYLQLLALNLVRQGGAFADKEDYAKADESYSEASIIQKTLLDRGVMPLGQYAGALLNMANLKLKSGKDLQAAGPLYQDAIGKFRELIKLDPDPQWKKNLAVALQDYGAWLARQDHKEEAHKQFSEAVGILRAACALDLGFYIRALSDALSNLAHCEAVSNKDDQAKTDFEEAISLRRRAVDSFASDERTDLAALAQLELDLAAVLRSAKRSAEMAPHCAAAVQLYKKLALHEDAEMIQKLGFCDLLLAERYENEHQSDKAMEAYNDFVDAARNGVRLDRKKYLEDYGKALIIRARYLGIRHQYDDALTDGAEAEKIFRTLEKNPEVGDEIAAAIMIRLNVSLNTDKRNLCQLSSEALKYAADAEIIQQLTIIKGMCKFVEVNH
jgi:tetratricopeptide (TPR) repeat protein